ATSSEWGPQFPILHSTDLVNWEITGDVFPHRPAWASANFWAPEIAEYKGKYYIYYVGRKKGAALAVAVATADKPSGPYTDHGPLVSQAAGSIDPVPFNDEKGQRYLIWKEDGNSRKLPTILWAQKLDEEGTKLIGEPKEILRNDAPWEGAVVEGPFFVRRDGWFYLFYSGSGCCGANCNYALGVARSKTLLGPWEKNPANPILVGNGSWRCPGHGSIIEDEKSRYWLLYHAYSAKDFIFTGREALLDEVKFDSNQWPTINEGKGPSQLATSPFGAQQKKLELSFSDNFSSNALKPGWQWPQDNEPRFHIETQDGGALILSPRPERSKDLLGAVLARSTTTGDYTATATLNVSRQKPSILAGLSAFGDSANAMGAGYKDNKLVLWRRDKGQHKQLAELEAPKGDKIHLRLSTRQGHSFQFAASADGQTWIPIGDDLQGKHLPPWDRSIRVALTVGGSENGSARFESVKIVPQ
ncbi:MAG TPA: family 43 glycosylhydrolase, partial [Candidatus Saccharimonadales bacterium]|nr:family 43 glycosylhydrolase [Candidatus Saccharimonadales bacterium]